MNRIGVGSTRSEVEADFMRRRENSRWSDFITTYVYRQLQSPWNLPDAEFGYVSMRFWTAVEFKFENDRVIKMRIGFYL